MSFIKEVTVYARTNVRVYITQCHNRGKTNLFAVRRDDGTGMGALLGLIKWSGRWRQYVFNPANGFTIWSCECLDKIVSFMGEQNKKQRKRFSRRKNVKCIPEK